METNKIVDFSVSKNKSSLDIKTTREITKAYNKYETIAYKKWVAVDDILKMFEGIDWTHEKTIAFITGDIMEELSEGKNGN